MRFPITDSFSISSVIIDSMILSVVFVPLQQLCAVGPGGCFFMCIALFRLMSCTATREFQLDKSCVTFSHGHLETILVNKNVTTETPTSRTLRRFQLKLILWPTSKDHCASRSEPRPFCETGLSQPCAYNSANSYAQVFQTTSTNACAGKKDKQDGSPRRCSPRRAQQT